MQERTFPRRRWRPGLVLVACLCATVGNLHADQPAADANGARFDALYADFHDANYFDAGNDRIDVKLAALKAALPPNDEVRRRRLAGMQCYGSGWGSDPATLTRLEADIIAADAQHDDAASRSHLQICKAMFLSLVGRTAEAMPFADRSLRLARDSNEPHLLAAVLIWRGELRSQRGDQTGSLDDLNEAYEVLTRRIGGPIPGSFLLQRAAAYRRMGEYETALQLLDDPAITRPHNGEDEWQTLVSQQRTFLYVDMHRPQDAIRSADAGLAHAKRSGNQYAMTTLRTSKAKALVELGRHAEALALTQDSSQSDDDAVTHGLMLSARGAALQGLGRSQEALAALDEAARLLEGDQNPRYLAEVYGQRSLAYESLGRDQAALDDLRRARKLEDAVRSGQISQRQALRELERIAGQSSREASVLRIQRRWQIGALALAALLFATLAALFVRQRRRSLRYQRMADTDELTGTNSRSAIMERLSSALRVSEHTKQPLSVLAVDADHFKQVNDRYGHPFGDQVLADLCKAMNSALRQEDRVGRIGGEEFLVVAPSTTLEQAHVIAERLRVAVERRFSETTGTTVSIGIAVSEPGERSIKTLIARADEALYLAKHNGRNRIMPGDLPG